jgi:hypothetical protein
MHRSFRANLNSSCTHNWRERNIQNTGTLPSLAYHFLSADAHVVCAEQSGTKAELVAPTFEQLLPCDLAHIYLPAAKFTCVFPECTDVTFGRLQDLKRHHRAFHQNTVLWCPAFDCPRNEEYGDNPYARRDKLMEHIRRMHKSEAEVQLWPVWFETLRRQAYGLR